MLMLRSENFAAFALFGFATSVVLLKSAAMNLFLFLLLLIFIADKEVWTLRYWGKMPRFVYFWVALAVFGILAILWSSTTDSYLVTSIKKLRFYILIPIFVVAFTKLKDWSNHFLTIVSLILILNLLYALFNEGGLYDRIFFGFTSAFLLSLVLNSLLLKQDIGANFLLLILILIGVFVVEDSRGGQISSLAVIIYFLTASIFSGVIGKKLFLLLILSTLLLVFIAFNLGHLDRFIRMLILIPGYFSGDLVIESFIERAEYIRFGLRGFLDNPMIGNGLGTYPMLATQYKSTDIDWGVVTNPHSQYTLILSELGVVGFVLYMAFFIGLISRASRLHESIRNIAYATVVLILVSSVYDSIFFDQRTGYFLVMLVSFIVSEIKKGTPAHG